MRQLIIARKDLQMSPGKLAAQVSHASMAFLTTQIRRNAEKVWKYEIHPSFRSDPFTGERLPGPRPYTIDGQGGFWEEIKCPKCETVLYASELTEEVLIAEDTPGAQWRLVLR